MKYLKHFYKLLFIIFLCSVISCNIDVDPPSVRAVTPAHQAVADIDTSINVIFSEKMDKTTAENSFSLYSDNGTVAGSFTWKNNGKSFTFNPELPLENGIYYTIYINKDAEDKNGNNLTKEYISSFFAGTDLIPPEVVSTTPENLTANYPLNGAITITFSEAMDRMSVERAIFFSPSINGKFDWLSDTSVVYNPFTPLDFNVDYTITISTDCKDTSGNPLLKKYEVFFTAGEEFIRPYITDLRTNPLSQPDQTGSFNWISNGNFYTWDGVEKNATLEFTFSEPVKRSSFSDAFNIFPDTDVSFIWAGDTSCSVRFNEQLIPMQKYELRVLKSLKDISGNEMSEDFIIYFLVNGENSRIPDVIAVNLMETDETQIAPLAEDTVVSPGKETSSENIYKISISFDRSMNPVSAHDNVMIDYISGDQPEITGFVKEYEWKSSNTALVVTLTSIKGGNLYKFTLKGGSGGILSAAGTAIKEDISYYFSFDPAD